MYVYSQRDGKLYRDGRFIAQGYSGHDVHKNVPGDDNLAMLGPCPKGFYTIGPAYNHTPPAFQKNLGPVVMNLMPDRTNEMHGRSLFRIHGDSVAAPGTASDGCLIFDHQTRISIEMGGDKRLQVVDHV